MALNWERSKVNYSDDEMKINHLANNVLGKHFKGIGDDVASNVNLYNFILKNLDTSNDVLAKSITDNGTPIFTEADIAEIKKVLKTHLDTPYSKKILGSQSGAGPRSVQEDDISRNKFWDRFFRGLASPISSRISPDGIISKISWWIFILYNLEQMDRFGPIISQFLDIITLSLPALAELTQELCQKLIGLVPLPYMSQAGELIGIALSTIFIITAVVLNNSRKHFGAAFKTALEAIPILGDSLSLAAMNFETAAERFEYYRNKYNKSVEKLSNPEVAMPRPKVKTGGKYRKSRYSTTLKRRKVNRRKTRKN
jgi:hypothetical protein